MSETTTNTARLVWSVGRVYHQMYRNLETGMVRSFRFGPHYGKWEKTTLRTASPPIGRAAMARLSTNKQEGAAET